MRLDPLPRFAKNLVCPICHSKAVAVGWQADDDLYNATKYQIVLKCSKCGIFSNVRLT